MTRPFALAAWLLALATALPAWAKPARCFTTDDGHYACDFRADDGKGSFTVTSPDTPSYSLLVDEPGFAYGYVSFGERTIPLVGRFERERGDPACWHNPGLGTRICAW